VSGSIAHVKQLIALVVVVCVFKQARSAEIFPAAQGTVWNYAVTEEFGEGVHPSDEENVKLDAQGKLHALATMYAAGPEQIDGIETHKFEMHRQGKLQMVEYLKIDDNAVTAIARALPDGNQLKLAPAQKVLTLPPRVGDKWEWKGKFGDNPPVEQTYEVVGKESVTVPAGKFDAFHLHITQKGFPVVTVDRWFVPEAGYVKDLTDMKFPNGKLLHRILLELTENPKKGERPAVAAATPAQKKLLEAALAKELIGEPTTEFDTNQEKIYVRWQGEALKKGDKIRMVWIAEDVGNAAPKNYKVDEASETATADGQGAFGTFTLSRPNKGWPPGQYRVEMYDGDQLADTIEFAIKAAK
jgi:hypothetical protein